jgi:hypothetical protein
MLRSIEFICPGERIMRLKRCLTRADEYMNPIKRNML